MIATTIDEQKQAKLKFFSLYAASVILLIIIFASVWKNEPQTKEIMVTSSTGADAKLLQINDLLQKKTQELDGIYALWVTDQSARSSNLANLAAAETSFKKSLDSLDNETTQLSSNAQKIEIAGLLANFRKSLESRRALQASYAVVLTDSIARTRPDVPVPTTTPITTPTNTAAVDELKALLNQKDQRIAAMEKEKQQYLQDKDKTILTLTKQLNQKSSSPVQPTVSNNEGEWKQKYAKIKSSYDNLAVQNETLNKSYKVVVEDNRRLLSQLQSSKKQ